MKKLKIRIAVAVDQTGAWNSYGWGDGKDKSDDKQAMANAAYGVRDFGATRYWVEAEVEVPEPVVVQGKVVPA